MLAILGEFADRVPQAIKRPPDAAGGLFRPRLAGRHEIMLKLHARLQQGLRRYRNRAGG